MPHLTHGLRAKHHNAAPPDLLDGVAALVTEYSVSRLAHSSASASHAELLTDTHLATAGTRAAQR
ncbi:hypothetical protein [Micromonospora sp. NPDC002717]|uniref:hypothetical protein n=1 Tax=Micromonospora sp. NPDC002717 TaxID=3154424 RepID=UPI0033306661